MKKDQLITTINIKKEKVQAEFVQQQMKLEEDKKILQ